MCWASAALPPLPNSKTFLPALYASISLQAVCKQFPRCIRFLNKVLSLSRSRLQVGFELVFGFLGGYEMPHDDNYLDIPQSISKCISKLPIERTDSGLCLGYYAFWQSSLWTKWNRRWQSGRADDHLSAALRTTLPCTGCHETSNFSTVS